MDIIQLNIAIAIFIVYMLPTFIAWKRGHGNLLAIGALNVLTGWSLLGWIGAFVWSLTNNRTARV